MPEAENGGLPGRTNDTWRAWLATGVRRGPVDRRRLRGEHLGLKRILVEGTNPRPDKPHAWKDFSDAMVRHAVSDAVRLLPHRDSRLVKLAYFGGLSNRQIATEVGLTEATVQRRLRRAVSVISEHVQHGRAAGRRFVYGIATWLSGRWLSDATHHAAQAAAVGGVAMLVAVQPAPVAGAAPAQPSPGHVATQPAMQPAPQPAAQPAPVSGVQAPDVPSVQPPTVQLPAGLPVTVPAPPPLSVPTPVKAPQL